MRHAGHGRYGHRLNGLIVVLWRARLRIYEALSLTETDLDQRRGSILVGHGKAAARSEWTPWAIGSSYVDIAETRVGDYVRQAALKAFTGRLIDSSEPLRDCPPARRGRWHRGISGERLGKK